MKANVIVYIGVVCLVLIAIGTMMLTPFKSIPYGWLLAILGLGFAFNYAASFYARKRINTWSPEARSTLATTLRSEGGQFQISSVWGLMATAATAIWIWFAVSYSLHGNATYLITIILAIILSFIYSYLPLSHRRPGKMALVGVALVLFALGWFIVVVRIVQQGRLGAISYHDSNLAFLPAVAIFLPGITMIASPLLALWRRTTRIDVSSP